MNSKNTKAEPSKGTKKTGATAAPRTCMVSLEMVARWVPVAIEKKVSWKFDTEYNGETLVVTFSGTLEAGQISGNIDIQPMSVNGTFTAKKGDSK